MLYNTHFRFKKDSKTKKEGEEEKREKYRVLGFQLSAKPSFVRVCV